MPSAKALKPNQFKLSTHELPVDGYAGPSPDLPGRHCSETRAWYEVWRTSPQAAVFLATDWQRLHLVAHLVDKLYDPEFEGNIGPIVGEIRQNEGKLGATVSDRQSMYMKTKTPAPAAADSETLPASSRRETLRVVDRTA